MKIDKRARLPLHHPLAENPKPHTEKWVKWSGMEKSPRVFVRGTSCNACQPYWGSPARRAIIRSRQCRNVGTIRIVAIWSLSAGLCEEILSPFPSTVLGLVVVL